MRLNITRRLPQLNICKYCGRSFNPWHKYNKFCSRKCAVRGRPGLLKRNKKKFRCDLCGKILEVKQSKVKKQSNFYCSERCYWIHKKINSKGKSNPNWKGGIDRLRKLHARGDDMSFRTGSYFERKTKKLLEREGYYVMKSGGSKGLFDLIATNNIYIRFIQVKAGTSTLKKSERDGIEKLKLPDNCKKEVWKWIKKMSKPIIYIVRNNELTIINNNN